MIRTCALDTPTGTFTVLERDGAVIAAGFTGVDTLRARLPEPAPVVEDPLPSIAGALEAYIEGNLRALDDVPVEQEGTPLQHELWQALRAIPPGDAVTYADLARAVGRPRIARAAGAACGRNRIALFVPCHRVVRADGSTGEYRYGSAIKAWLLAHERRAAPMAGSRA